MYEGGLMKITRYRKNEKEMFLLDLMILHR
jgi:hypothetical protein